MTAGSSLAAFRVQRIALWLVACALLFRVLVPAGWMPIADANGLTLGWCSGVRHAVPAEARALLDQALPKSETPRHQPSPDQPCAFAAAAQTVAATDPMPAIRAPEAAAPAPFLPLALIPGRGLAAPPPRSTGPPLLA